MGFGNTSKIGYGKHLYELGLYDGEKLIQIYRTGTFDGVGIIIGQANLHAKYLGIESILKSPKGEVVSEFEEVEAL